MKELKGRANNIAVEIIGKISKNQKFLPLRKSFIYVTENDFIPIGYSAVITSKNIKKKNSGKFIDQVDKISELNDNDVVLIEPNGRIVVLYDNKSTHNAIFVTGRCNSNCIMCPQPPTKDENSNFDSTIKLISLINKESKHLGITGGEPTLLGDQLFDIINAIYKRIPKATINMLSNGIRFEDYLFAKKFAKSLKQNYIIDIPLFSDIDTIHNSIVRTNSFYKTINGIYNLARFNVKIGIRVVIHRMNYDRLPEMAEFIYSNFPFAYHVTFVQMEPTGYALENINKLWIDPLDYNDQLELAVLNLKFRDLNVSIYNSQLCILPASIRQFAIQSISDWKDIYLEECNECLLKPKCAGFFASSKDLHSRGIIAIHDNPKNMN